jgi:hypothetical protein
MCELETRIQLLEKQLSTLLEYVAVIGELQDAHDGALKRLLGMDEEQLEPTA